LILNKTAGCKQVSPPHSTRRSARLFPSSNFAVGFKLIFRFSGLVPLIFLLKPSGLSLQHDSLEPSRPPPAGWSCRSLGAALSPPVCWFRGSVFLVFSPVRWRLAFPFLFPSFAALAFHDFPLTEFWSQPQFFHPRSPGWHVFTASVYIFA